MANNRHRIAFCLSLLGLAGIGLTSPTSAMAAANESGEQGAKIYCYMRDNGNNHDVSWSASYAVIKRQTGGVFKSSPEHASVMITEAVVEQPENYPNCGQYLGDLFKDHKKSAERSGKETETDPNSYTSDNTNNNVSDTDSEQRYNY